MERNLLPRRALSQIVASFGRASGQMTSPTRLAGWRSGRPPEGSVPKDAVDRVHPELSRPRGLSNAPAERSAPVAVCACHHAVVCVFFEIGDARINVRRESAATTTCSCYDPRPRATAAATAAAAAEFTPDPRPLRARLRCPRPSPLDGEVRLGDTAIKTKSFWNGVSTRLVEGGWIHNGKARKTRAGS